MTIYTPLAATIVGKGCQTCTKIEFRGLEISISMDNSCAPPYSRDLSRTEIRVFDGEADVTERFGGPWHDADGLYEAMNAIAQTTASAVYVVANVRPDGTMPKMAKVLGHDVAENIQPSLFFPTQEEAEGYRRHVTNGWPQEEAESVAVFRADFRIVERVS